MSETIEAYKIGVSFVADAARVNGPIGEMLRNMDKISQAQKSVNMGSLRWFLASVALAVWLLALHPRWSVQRAQRAKWPPRPAGSAGLLAAAAIVEALAGTVAAGTEAATARASHPLPKRRAALSCFLRPHYALGMIQTPIHGPAQQGFRVITFWAALALLLAIHMAGNLLAGQYDH